MEQPPKLFLKLLLGDIKLVIRDLLVADSIQVMRLLQDVSKYALTEDDAKKAFEIFINDSNSYGIVAIVNDKVVGFGSAFIIQRVRGGSVAIVEDFVVSSHYRRSGVGTLIMEKLVANCRLRGCFKIVLETSEIGYKFYESLGFVKGGASMKLSIKG